MKNRVLIVEDDPSVRLFVQVALQPLEIDVVQCATITEAKTMLADRMIRLVITDLNLPDGTGLDLLAWMRSGPSPRLVSCRSVVFSGGIEPGMAKKLESLEVWRVLHKPTSVGALIACVSEALSNQGCSDGEEAPPDWQDPVSEFFGGNCELFEAYRQACLAQFPQDLLDGDVADRALDAAALRLVAHNLKSVLTMLGEARAAQWARDTEERAANQQTEPMHAAWLLVRSHIQALIALHNPQCALRSL